LVTQVELTVGIDLLHQFLALLQVDGNLDLACGADLGPMDIWLRCCQGEVYWLQLNTVGSHELIDDLDLNHVIWKEEALWDYLWQIIKKIVLLDLGAATILVLTHNLHLEFGITFDLTTRLQVLDILIIELDFRDA
jgi:hypothetical protein